MIITSVSIAVALKILLRLETKEIHKLKKAL